MVSVIVGVVLARFRGVMLGLNVMTVGDVGVVAGFLMVSGFMMARGCAMVLGSVFVVICSFMMMLGGFF
jgi:hypothetical protein